MPKDLKQNTTEDEGEVQNVVVEKNKPAEAHKLKVINGQVVCVSCKCNHTVSIDPNKISMIQSI